MEVVSLGITGRVTLGGRRGGNFVLQACFSQTVYYVYTVSSIVLAGYFFWFLCNAGIFFLIFALHDFFVLFLDYPRFTFLMVRP